MIIPRLKKDYENKSIKELINERQVIMEKIVTIENEYIFNKDNNEHIEVKMIAIPSMDTIWSVLNEDLDMINDLIIEKSTNNFGEIINLKD